MKNGNRSPSPSLIASSTASSPIFEMRAPMQDRTDKSEFQALGALVSEFIELTRESDRGVILVAGAMLDARLERAIRARLRDDTKVADSLLGVDRPVGAFSAKIRLAYLLGLITQSEQRELDLVRRIRNRAAHESGAATFDAFSDQITVLSQRVPEGFGAPHFKKPLGLRDRFLIIVADLTSALEQSTVAAERVSDVVRSPVPFRISWLLKELSRMLPVFWDQLPSMLPEHLGSGLELSVDELSTFCRRLFNTDGTNSPEASIFALYLRHADQHLALIALLGRAKRVLNATRGPAPEIAQAQSSPEDHVDRHSAARSALKDAQEAATKWQEQLQAVFSSPDVPSADLIESVDASAARALEAYSVVVLAFSGAGLSLPDLHEGASGGLR